MNVWCATTKVNKIKKIPYIYIYLAIIVYLPVVKTSRCTYESAYVFAYIHLFFCFFVFLRKINDNIFPSSVSHGINIFIFFVFRVSNMLEILFMLIFLHRLHLMNMQVFLISVHVDCELHVMTLQRS